MLYRADYQNEDVFEIIDADSNEEAINEASKYEDQNGSLWNVYLLNDDFEEVECIF